MSERQAFVERPFDEVVNAGALDVVDELLPLTTSITVRWPFPRGGGDSIALDLPDFD